MNNSDLQHKEFHILRNQIVTLIYLNRSIEIKTEARALGSARIGEEIRVLNIATRRSLIGVIVDDGVVRVMK